MKFSRKRGVSPIIATLLLIAIAVAAGIIVYVYVNSLAGGLTGGGGQQVAVQLQLQAYSFNTAGTGNGQFLDIFLKNVGGASITISAIYVDGNVLTEWIPTSSAYTTPLMVPSSVQSCFAALPTAVTVAIATSGASADGSAASCTTTSGTCGTSAPFCLALTGTPTETLTLAAQAANQILVGLNSAVTGGTSHNVKIITTTGGQSVFTVTAGRTG